MGLRIVAHIAVRAVANGPSPEVPFEVLGRLEILEQVPRVVDVPTQQAHCPGLVEKEGDGVVVNDLSRVHAPGTVPLEVRVSPQLDVELDVPRGDRDAVMPPYTAAQIDGPAPPVGRVLPAFREPVVLSGSAIVVPTSQREKHEKLRHVIVPRTEQVRVTAVVDGQRVWIIAVGAVA